jgi:hypothetical protein
LLYVGCGGNDSNWSFLLFFDTFAFVVRVRLDIELNEVFDLLHLGDECIFASHHFLLGFCGLDVAFFNSLLGLVDLVESLLFVSERFALSGEENVVCSRVVKGKTFLFLLLVLLLVGRSAHYLNWGD